MKDYMHFLFIGVFIYVVFYGISIFDNTLRQHYLDEAKAARQECFHRVDELEIKRGEPYGGNPGESCASIGLEYNH